MVEVCEASKVLGDSRPKTLLKDLGCLMDVLSQMKNLPGELERSPGTAV
jgi:hypothetical protein